MIAMLLLVGCELPLTAPAECPPCAPEPTQEAPQPPITSAGPPPPLGYTPMCAASAPDDPCYDQMQELAQPPSSILEREDETGHEMDLMGQLEINGTVVHVYRYGNGARIVRPVSAIGHLEGRPDPFQSAGVADVNGDGLEDLVLTALSGRKQVFLAEPSLQP